MTVIQYQADAQACKQLLKKHGKSYAFATRFFSKNTRLATQVLYAFFRLPDEIVDNPKTSDLNQTKKDLLYWKDVWKKAYDNVSGWEIAEDVPSVWVPILRATSRVFHEYGIPYKYSEEFISAMIQDTEKTEYQTYAELEKYMYGSAAVVGLMMSHVIGFTDKRALLFAEELGYAMQLTNFLRDIKEDLEERGRVYLPKAELESFGITKAQLLEHRVDEPFRRFMGYQMSRARALYVSADEGVSLLREDGRFPVRLAATLYEAILDEIEHQKCDVFVKRAKTTKLKKIILALGVWKAEKQR